MSSAAPTTVEQRVSDLEQAQDKRAAEDARAGKWIRWVAASTAVFAALAAFGAVKSAGFANESLARGTEAVLYQAQASDAYSEYQANSLKRHINDDSAPGLRALAHLTGDTVLGSQADQLDQSTRDKYLPAQQPLLEKAQGLERQRDAALRAAGVSQSRKDEAGLSVGIFQGAIGLSSVATLLKRRELWLLSLASGVGGLVLLAPTLLG